MGLQDVRTIIEILSRIAIMQFFSNPRSIQASTPEKRVPYVACDQEQVVH